MPDFLVIGAQKAGTTWLHHHLQQHDDVWLPPIKELHYFDRSPRPLFLDAFHGKYDRFMLRRWLRVGLDDVVQHPANLMWHARFFLTPRDDRWYARCFSNSGRAIAGEVCPAYARLDDAGVDRVAKLLPDAKIVYILRNPVERMWSQAAMYFSRYGHSGLANASIEQIERFLAWDKAQANNRYDTVISRWSRHFPDTQLHVAFYDQLEEDPADFFSGICRFLGIEPRCGEGLSEKIHAGEKVPMPPQIRRQLSAEYLPEVTRLDRRFANRYTADWVGALRSKIGTC
ncbi:sulfotransferase [Aurantiacibacter sp. MUD11]|uniref:sulfotransferase family protein n=1 Tax=Aurantiacibacter sp. MUD11 TaxID=3003265 RepID=UPI0022AB2B56|nr:sulfotransferase [Aurantiacibacter sp. MUD11]WAT18951.1 sulfotransferase [Aurantiacibacter sp. MUD11]